MKHRRGIDLTTAGEAMTIGNASELAWMSFEKLSEWYVLGACCQSCGRTNWLDRWELQGRYGKATFLETLRPKLKCIHCKERGRSHFVIGKMPRNV